MKNLKIDRVNVVEDLELKESDEFAINPITGKIYIAKKDFLLVVSEENKIEKKIEWGEDRQGLDVISLTCRSEGDQIVAILEDSRAIIIDVFTDEVTAVEVCEAVNRHVTAAEWSSDEQTLVIADDEKAYFADSSLIPYYDRELEFSEDERASAPVNVGWGSELTQFRGSAGKIKEGEKKEEEEEKNEKSVIDPTDARAKSVVHWRWDDELVAVSFFSRQKQTRFLTIFDRTGQVLSTMNIRNINLSTTFAHKPNSNLLCSAVVLKENSSDELVFYERNGETRNGYSMKWSSLKNGEARVIKRVLWNSTGSILGLHTKVGEQEYLEFWRLSNYEFTKKFVWKVSGSIVWKWSSIEESRVHVLAGEKFVSIDISPCSSYSQDLSMNVVVASDELRVSSLCRRAIPPPMCETSIKISADDGDIVVYTTSPGSIHALTTAGRILKYSIQNSASFEKISEIEVTDKRALELPCGILFDEKRNSYIIWSKNTIWRVAVEKGDVETIHTSEGISWVGINPKSKSVELAELSGEFFDEKGTKLFKIKSFERIQVFYSEEKRVVLTDDATLFVDSKEVASNVTSVLTRGPDAMFIDYDNKLRFVDLEKLEVGSEDGRDVEAGSELVAAHLKSTNVVLQAARGNLETIQPRRFVLIQTRKFLDAKKYVEAFKWMKKHRIDMSYAMEYKKEELIEDAEVWLKVETPADSQLLEQLVVSCTQKFEPEEGNRLCQTIFDRISALETGEKTKYFPLLLTSLLTSTPTRTNDALKEINEHAGKIAERKDVFTRQSLHHVSFFVPAKQLFNCSLSTYDLKLAQQVAEASNYDPMEYLPVLNKLNQVPCEMERKYRINVVREAWGDALKSLFELDSSEERGNEEEWWNDAKNIIQRESLHQTALKILNPGDKRFKNCCDLYAAELEKKIHWKEAAMFHEMAGNVEKTLKCWEMSRDVDGLVSAARRCKLDAGKLKIHAIKMSAALKEARLLGESAKAMKLAGSASYSVIQTLCEAQEWRRAMLELESVELEDRAMKVLAEAARGRAENVMTELERRSAEFDRYRKRLEVVRSNKLVKVEKFAAGEIEDFRDDMSQISSVSSRTGSGSSKVSMASTVRRRKQIDKKKASLKEGGEYEDSALLNVLAEQYRWMEQIRNEISQLIPALMTSGRMNEAFELKTKSDEFADKLVKAKAGIWPENLTIQKLPGPLYALFDASQEPSPIPMPPVFRIEPELIAPSSSFSPVFP